MGQLDKRNFLRPLLKARLKLPEIYHSKGQQKQFLSKSFQLNGFFFTNIQNCWEAIFAMFLSFITQIVLTLVGMK